MPVAHLAAGGWIRPAAPASHFLPHGADGVGAPDRLAREGRARQLRDSEKVECPFIPAAYFEWFSRE